MAYIFKNKFATLTTTNTKYYTAQPTSSAIVVHLQAANANTASNNTVSVAVSSSDGYFYLAYNLVVPYKSAVGLLTGQLILSGSNQIWAFCSSSTSPDRVDLTIGTIEHV